jgi:serine/threonine protein kinase
MEATKAGPRPAVRPPVKTEEKLKQNYLRALEEEEERVEREFAAKRESADANLSVGLWPGHSMYEVGDMLGRGAFGSVFEGRRRQNGSVVAIKRIDGLFSSSDVAISAMREINLHAHVDAYGGRGSVTRLIEVIEPEVNDAKFDHMYSVYEKFDSSLYGAMKTRKWRLVTAEEKRAIVFKLCVCVARLHSCDVAHRDIKPENIVVKHEFHQIALCDLGMARMTRKFDAGDARSSKLTDYVTTRWYRAPEVCCGMASSSPERGVGMMAADVWSLACVMGEILAEDHKPLLCGDGSVSQARLIGMALGPMNERTTQYYENYSNNIDALDSILEGSVCLPSSIDNDSALRSVRSLIDRGVPASAVDLMQNMLTYDPRSRISADAVLTHPFFAGLTPPAPPSSPERIAEACETSWDGAMRWSTPEQARHRIRQSVRDCNTKLKLHQNL